jgi:hypothetical protein
MSDTQVLKQRLLSSQWREYSRVEVATDDGTVELVIRRPPDAVLTTLLAEARAEGLNAGGGDESKSETALHFRAKVVAATVFLPNERTALFTPAEALVWPGLQDVAGECMAALAPGKALEAAKGN